MKHILGYVIQKGGYSVVDVIANIDDKSNNPPVLQLIMRKPADNFIIPIDALEELITEWKENK